MKFLIRTKKEDNSFFDMVTAHEEYNHIYQEVEQLPEKEGYYVTYNFNKDTNKVVGKYVEIPKTKEQLLEEEIEKIKRAIASEGEPDLSELGELGVNAKTNKKKVNSTPDLSELENL